MKKQFITTMLLLIIVSTFISSCTPKSASQNKNKKPDCALKIFLDSCLSEQPNAMNNDITKSILADTIKSRMQKFCGDSLIYISGIPFQYKMALEYPKDSYDKNAGKYVVKFGHSEMFTKYKISDKYEVSFQVFTIMDKEAVANLIDNNLYFINGTFVDFANNSQETGFVLPSGKCLVSYPSVSKSVFDSSKPSINLGTMILENVSFKPIGNEKVNQSQSN